jgi:hypothetical protein
MFAVGIVAVAAILTFVVIAIVQVAHAGLGYIYKVLWVAAIVVFPVFGTIAWYLLGDRTKALERAITAHTL